MGENKEKQYQKFRSSSGEVLFISYNGPEFLELYDQNLTFICDFVILEEEILEAE